MGNSSCGILHRRVSGSSVTSVSADDTAASEHGADAETTQVPPPPRDEPGLAWSVDDDDDETPIDWRGQLMWAGLSVLVIAVAAALVLLISTLFGGHATNTARTRAGSVTTSDPDFSAGL